MAETLAAVGIAASILQLIDFGFHVLERLEDYQSKLGDIPEAFRDIKAELPVLLDALKQTKAAIDAGLIQNETKKALLPAIDGCKKQINLLDDLVIKALPVAGDSWGRRSRKAMGSLRYDEKVKKMKAVIQGYIQALTYHAAASSTLRHLTGMRIMDLIMYLDSDNVQRRSNCLPSCSVLHRPFSARSALCKLRDHGPTTPHESAACRQSGFGWSRRRWVGSKPGLFLKTRAN